jgi:beta-glucosidase
MAVKSMVLLKNDNNILPLDMKKIKKVALIGPLAKSAPTGGGGSSHVSPYYNIGPLEGITNLINNKVEVTYALGSVLPLTPVTPIPADFLKTNGQQGLKAEFFNNMDLSGEPIYTRIDPIIDFSWNDAAPIEQLGRDHFSIRWTGTIVPPESRGYTFLHRVMTVLECILMINS